MGIRYTRKRLQCDLCGAPLCRVMLQYGQQDSGHSDPEFPAMTKHQLASACPFLFPSSFSLSHPICFLRTHYRSEQWSRMPYFFDNAQNTAVSLPVRGMADPAAIAASSSSQSAQDQRDQRLRIQTRRRRYLEMHPEYFSAANLELSGSQAKLPKRKWEDASMPTYLLSRSHALRSSH